MSRSRHAPHRIRSRYLNALTALPIPVDLAYPFDTTRLTVLGTRTVAGRAVDFGTTAAAPRLWVAFADTEPALIGYMTGLLVGEPDLWLCEAAHREWVHEGDNTRRLKEAAGIVWFSRQRDCDG